MERIVERFISYTKIDTTSCENGKCPSNDNEFILAHQLEEELKQLDLQDVHVDEHGFVYGTLPSNSTVKCDTVGFLSHMDTSDAASGKNVRARIIENYDGRDIVLNEGIVTAVAEYPALKKLVGKSLIVTDGTTLLGGDDKAGIAIIMDALEKLKADPAVKHGEIRVCFTPDEETGSGIENIALDDFRCDYAYTVDGGEVEDVTYENFNAATAIVDFSGNSIHPGDAKDKMINALQLAVDFHGLLPENQRPENTEGREGFNHIVSLEGACEKARAVYIIRNHDSDKLQKQIDDFHNGEDYMNRRYGKQVITVTIREGYRNMKEEFAGRMYIIDQVKEVLTELGHDASSNPVRGGTDGSKLTFMGIPTPNLGTGGHFCHGNHELVCIEDMKEMVKVLIGLVQHIERKGK